MIHKCKSFIRYPGSKAKLTGVIRSRFACRLDLPLFRRPGQTLHYAEPFVGAGATFASLLDGFPRTTSIYLNDKDYGIVCLWKTLADTEETKELCLKIEAFTPSADAFYEFKESDGQIADPLEAAFRKLALHQISYSGLGVMAGGPLGGRSQNNSQYTPDCRWRPENLKRDIVRLSRTLRRFRHIEITCKDFSVPLSKIPPSGFVYLDPPYYEKGAELYKHHMVDADHVRLADLLRTARYEWALSYDDHPRIRELYSWANVENIAITYTTATANNGRRPKNHEVIITPEAQ